MMLLPRQFVTCNNGQVLTELLMETAIDWGHEAKLERGIAYTRCPRQESHWQQSNRVTRFASGNGCAAKRARLVRSISRVHVMWVGSFRCCYC